MSKENKTLENLTEGNDFIADVSKRFYCLVDAWRESGNCDKQCEDCKANIVKQ